MRRRFLLAAVGLPISLAIAAAVVAPGCGSEEPLDDICGWLQDPDGCYREFHDEIRTRCGATFTAATTDEIKVSEPVGSFFLRDTLDVCVLEGGGQVVFDPAPSLESFPLTTLGFKRLDARSEECGSMSFTNTFNFSVTINACTDDATDEAPVCKDSMDGLTSVSGEGRDPTAVIGGSFSVVSEEGRDIYVTTCPSGEAFRFNRFESVKCDGYEQLLPRAEIESDPGGTVLPWESDIEPYKGWIRFRVYYPPYEGELADAEPVVVQYFNCTIPPQYPCADGIKNYYETDVDCGGPLAGEVPPNEPGALEVVHACERCQGGQICESSSDCEGGVACDFDASTGFNRCADEGGTGGTGGTGGSGGSGG